MPDDLLYATKEVGIDTLLILAMFVLKDQMLSEKK